MKGGVGKTTISAHLFRVFYRHFQAGVLLLDLDPQFNLTQALFSRDDYEELKKEGKTIYAAMEPSPSTSLFEVKTSAAPPPKPKDISKRLWYFSQSNPVQELAIVPGDFSLVKYSLMDVNRKLMAVRERFIKFVESSRTSYKLTCIDCNPSSSFLTLCALHSCTHILVPVRPDRYSILGLELLSDFVDSIPTISPKPEIIVILNGVPRTNYDRTTENELRAHSVFGPLTLANKIHKSKLLEAHSGYTGFATDKKVPYKETLWRNLTNVAEELKDRLELII